MAYLLQPVVHPVIRIIKFYETLTPEDMKCIDALGLNEQPRCIVVDAARLRMELPPDFVAHARASFLTHPNCRHVALFVRSARLRNLALMVAKLTRMQYKLSLHDTLDDALAAALQQAHLLRL